MIFRKYRIPKMEINIFLDYFLNLLFYMLTLGLMALIFKKTIYFDENMRGLWFIITSIIIFTLNKTIKPLIIWITLPITGITLGLFYPFINVVIIKLADAILGNHFNTGGIWMTLLVALLIGFFTMQMDEFFVNPLLERNRIK